MNVIQALAEGQQMGRDCFIVFEAAQNIPDIGEVLQVHFFFLQLLEGLQGL